MNDLNKTEIQLLKINEERRKRHQLYITMEYSLKSVSFYDFFSAEAFTLLTEARFLSQIAENSSLSIEFLFLAFLNYPTKTAAILETCGIKEENIEQTFFKYFSKYKNKIRIKKKFFTKSYFFTSGEEILEPEPVDYFLPPEKKILPSFELNRFFEKAFENSLTRFKTPVITPEILFITMMEEKSVFIEKFLKSICKNEIEWYLLRYKLLKHLHRQESYVREEIVLNQHYFAYLLKIKLDDYCFDKLIETEKLGDAVMTFRNLFLAELLKIDLLKNLSDEIYQSIRITRNRKYSS